jgi:hypothetical protein
MPLPRYTFTPLLLIFVVGCTSSGQLSADGGKPANASQPSPVTHTKSKTQTLKLKLTLDSPADLLVAEGDQVSKEQLISDRKSVRLPLEAQRQVLQLKLQVLKEKEKPRFRDPVIEPEPMYEVELARIESARSEVQQFVSQIQRFEGSSLYTPVAWQQLPMQEQRQELGVLQQKLEQARGDLKVAIAQLGQAKYEYRRRVSVAKAKAEIPLQEAINPVEKLQVVQELQQVEGQIQAMGKVKAPQAGMIKKIWWLGMQDQTLQAEVSLAIQGSNHEKPAH